MSGNIFDPLGNAIYGVFDLLTDYIVRYINWNIDIWLGDNEKELSLEELKDKFESIQQENEIDEMKNVIKEYEDKIKALSMPKYIKYEYVWVDKNNTLKACIGKDIDDNYVFIDFYKNNHLLIAGATGYGKTSLIRNILISLMIAYTDIKIILVDFKNTDLPPFEIYKHINRECIYEEARFEKMLDSISKEGSERAKKIKDKGYFNVIDYNANETDFIKPIIIVIDEVAQICDNKKLRSKLIKCMGLVRAYGIFFIVATQIPSKDTVGYIKSHTIHRIGFTTADATDSSLIMKGANLQDMNIKGRCKYDVDGKLILMQSFFTTMEDVKGYLEEFKK